MAHILVADSNPHIRTLYQFMFRDYDVGEAGSVSQALEYLDRWPTDLLLTEWEFPDGTAQVLLEHLLKTGRTPVILVSGLQDQLPPLPDIVKRRFDKPFHLPELHSTVKGILAV